MNSGDIHVTALNANSNVVVQPVIVAVQPVIVVVQPVIVAVQPGSQLCSVSVHNYSAFYMSLFLCIRCLK